MFIRRTETRSTESGDYFSYRLVDSYRVGDRVRQRTLLNLGADFPVPRGEWPLLADRIQQILQGRESLLPEKPQIE